MSSATQPSRTTDHESAREAGPYILSKTVGSGRTGVVRIGEHKETHQCAAVKVISKRDLVRDPKLKGHCMMEVQYLSGLKHPNIIQFLGKVEDDSFLFIILEYMPDGDLYDVLNQGELLEQSLAKDIFYQLMLAVEFCHSKNMCHRDLKPENILIQKSPLGVSLAPSSATVRVVLADFGFACEMRTGHLLSTCCGSTYYVSPEVLFGSPYDGFKADIWSCGVILYALLTTRLPFYDEVQTRYKAKLCSGKYEMPPFLPKPAQELLEGALAYLPKNRLSASAIVKHPWLRDARNYINPNTLGVAENGASTAASSSSSSIPDSIPATTSEMSLDQSKTPSQTNLSNHPW